jgi:azurin
MRMTRRNKPSDPFRCDALQRRTFLFAAMALPACFPRTTWAADTVELHIESDGEFLAFLPEALTCRTGANVRVVFHHAGARVPQDHNWVLLKPGTAEAFITAVMAAGEKNGWMPPGDKRVLAATPLCGPGMTAMVEFTAPKPGDYPFVCSFAGHGAEMRGMLHVTA